MQRILWSQVVVHAVKKAFFISFIVNHGEFRRIQKSPAVQTAQRYEVPPLFAAVSHVESRRRRSKIPERPGKASRGLSHSQSRPRRDLDHQARLVAKLRRWRAGN